MECLSDQILQFNNDTLQTVRKLYDFDNVENINKAVDTLEEWVKMQRHFIKKDFSREYLERIFIIGKCSMERAKQRLDKLCTVKTLLPQYYGDFNLKTDFKDYNSVVMQALLPKMTKDHNRVFLLKNIGQKFKPTLMSDFVKTALYVCEYQLNHDYVNSYIIILDYLEANIMELSLNLNPVDVRNGQSLMTQGYGMRVKGIHILSTSKTIEVIVSMLKQVLSQKIGQRIHVHKSIEELHNFVPKDILPVEYGGKEKSLKTLRDIWLDAYSTKEFKEFYNEMREAKTDESCRQKDKFNEEYLGMPGSFRSLSVD